MPNIFAGQEATVDGLKDAVVFEGLKGVSKVATVLTPAPNALLYQVLSPRLLLKVKTKYF